ncbi:MAG: transcriptional regulator, partial [Gracilibacteraceae bacterium]|nr:transcriptional regulator [Gracilibacteraceae bacterium]
MGTYMGLLTMQKLLNQIEIEYPKIKFPSGTKICFGKVGTMNIGDVFGAIITSAKKENIIDSSYREEHSLYAAIDDALYGVCRGHMALRETLRTISLRFVVAR